MRKQTPSGYHHGNLRSALVDVAMEHLRSRGPGGISLRGAAREVGVSRAAPYRHFRSKEALLASVAEMGFRDLRGRLEGASEAHPGDSDAAFLALARVFFRFTFDHPALYCLMFGPPIKQFRNHEALHRAAEGAFAVVLDLVERGQRRHDFVGGPPRGLAAFAWSALHGLADLNAEGRLGITNRAALDQFAVSVSALVLRALRHDS